jgi:hypothetical protein
MACGWKWHDQMLARKIATIVLIVWKRGVCFDANHLKPTISITI